MCLFFGKKKILAEQKALAEKIDALQKEIDFNSLGGGVILGVKKIVVKSHGCSNSETIFNCAVQALKMYDGGFTKELI